MLQVPPILVFDKCVGSLSGGAWPTLHCLLCPSPDIAAPFLLRSRFWFSASQQGRDSIQHPFHASAATQVSGPDFSRAVKNFLDNASLRRRPGVPDTRGFRGTGWRPSRSVKRGATKEDQRQRSAREECKKEILDSVKAIRPNVSCWISLQSEVE